MDPLQIDLIKTVSLEAIKILGPAVVAALTGYWAARLQYVSKLKELERSNEFNARQQLFDYYKNQQAKLAERHKELADGLGQVLAFAAVADDDEKNTKIVKAFMGTVSTYISIVPFDIDMTRRDMKTKGLEATDEYQKLGEYHDSSLNLKSGESFETTQANVYILFEIYSFLERCNQLLLERQMEGLFSKYMKNA